MVCPEGGGDGWWWQVLEKIIHHVSRWSPFAIIPPRFRNHGACPSRNRSTRGLRGWPLTILARVGREVAPTVSRQPSCVCGLCCGPGEAFGQLLLLIQPFNWKGWRRRCHRIRTVSRLEPWRTALTSVSPPVKDRDLLFSTRARQCDHGHYCG